MLLTTCRSTIAQAAADSHHFPLAAFKLLLDVFYLSRLLGLKSILLGAAIPILFIPLSRLLTTRHQALQSEKAKAHTTLSALITEALSSLHHIRLASLESFWRDRLLAARAAELDLLWSSGVTLELLTLVANLGPVLFASASLSVYAYENDRLSPAVAFASLGMFANLHRVFKQLPVKAASVHESWIACDKIEAYLALPEHRTYAEGEGAMKLEGATVAWPGGSVKKTEEKKVFKLRDVDLEFPAGEMSVIEGQVGSGKSLLLAALLEEAVLESGSLTKPPLGVAADESEIVPGSVAFVSQPPWIEDLTVQENIVFGGHFDQKRYDAVIKACAMEHDLAVLENGDQTKAGAGGSSLSGGQKWRVALARALYSHAEFLILEDVLGAVDTPVARWICDYALSGDLATGRTIILATHRPEFCIEMAAYHVIVRDGTAVGTKRLKQAKSNTKSVDQDAVKEAVQADFAAKPEKKPTKKRPKPKATLDRSYKQVLWEYLVASGSFKAYVIGAFITIAFRVVSAGHTWWLTQWTSEEGAAHQNSTTFNVVVYMLLSLGSAVGLTMQTLLFNSIGLRASNTLFSGMVQSIMAATLQWIDNTPFGQIVQSLDMDIYQIDEKTAPQLNGMFSSAIHLLFICVTR